MEHSEKLCARAGALAPTLMACAVFLLITQAVVHAQTTPPAVPSTPVLPTIVDNSFLIEEAYNQNPGFVQHINNFTYSWTSKDWTYTFTQEWPVPRHARHQLSFSVVAAHAGDFIRSGVGPGDFTVNYRYQVFGSSSTPVAFAPRIGVLLPTGDPRYGRGAGEVGVQVNLPFSWVIHPRLASHTNLGITHTPRAQDEFGDHATVTSYKAGQSFVFFVHRRVNFMLETVWVNSADTIGPDAVKRFNEVIISPGLRWAYNFPSDLQIVPGFAVPMGVGPTAGQRGIIIYLSFEYSMWNER